MNNLCKHGCGKPGIVKVVYSDEWRCSKSPHSCPAVKENKKRLLKEKYGVENVSQLKEVQKRREATIMDRYGVANPWQMTSTKELIKDKWSESLEKRETTSMEKYGVGSYASTDEFKTRRKKTWIEKYGVDNPTKDKDILHKAMVSNGESEYRTKSFVFPSGKKVRCQGYEGPILQELLDSGIHEDDIVVSRKLVPRVKYKFEGKSSWYYPDIYIPRLSMIIEVKSLYTWKKYKMRNLAKRAATKAAGFNINIIIRDNTCYDKGRK
jgi:hypothetical protein